MHELSRVPEVMIPGKGFAVTGTCRILVNNLDVVRGVSVSTQARRNLKELKKTKRVRRKLGRWIRRGQLPKF